MIKIKGDFWWLWKRVFYIVLKLSSVVSPIRELLKNSVIQLSPLRRCGQQCLCLKVDHSFKLIHIRPLLLNVQITGLNDFFFLLNTSFSFNMSICLYGGKKFSHDLLNQYCRTQNITGDQETWALIQPCYSHSAVWPWEKACPFPNHMVSFPIKWVHWVMWALKFCLYLSFLSDDQIHVAFFLPHCDSPHLPVCTHGVHS